MAKCGRCGRSNGMPTNVPMKDMTKGGTTRTVQTNASLAGNRPMLKDQQKGSKLNVMKPLK